MSQDELRVILDDGLRNFLLLRGYEEEGLVPIGKLLES